jgi:hypothetical protein
MEVVRLWGDINVTLRTFASTTVPGFPYFLFVLLVWISFDRRRHALYKCAETTASAGNIYSLCLYNAREFNVGQF